MINGLGSHRIFDDEAGVHRIQRTPPTEKRGRTHTSAITVAVFDNKKHADETINIEDISFSSTRGSGKGGQRKNKVETCIVATHIPTGLTCRADTSSQYKSKKLAISILSKKLNELNSNKNQANEKNQRRDQIGKNVGRGDKRRTYREKDDMVKDHILNKRWKFSKWMKGIWK